MNTEGRETFFFDGGKMADTRLQQLAKTDRNPVEETEYQELLRQQREAGGAGVTAPAATDPIALAQQMYQMLGQYKAPAIETLQAGYGKIPQVFEPQRQAIEAEREPLEQRYQSLLKDITGYTTTATAREFGRRGIPLSSGVYETALAERIEPQVRTIGLEKEAGLRELTGLSTSLAGKEAEMGLNLDQAIAAIQAATGQSAVDAALSLFSTQQQAKTAEAGQTIQQALADLQRRGQEWTEQTWATEWPTTKALTEAQTRRYLQLALGGGGADEWE